MIDELTFSVSDEPGALYAALQALAARDVNVLAALAIGGTFADFAVVVLVCSPVDVAMEVLRENGFRFQRKQVLGVALEDRPGRLARITGLLADVGVNLRHLYHTEYVSPAGLPVTILSVDDATKAVAALRKGDIEVFDELPGQSVAANPDL
jgi:hypothetical protein